jgi:hypothetical protein
VTKEFAEQPQCRDLVALGLNENFENPAFAVNGTPAPAQLDNALQIKQIGSVLRSHPWGGL